MNDGWMDGWKQGSKRVWCELNFNLFFLENCDLIWQGVTMDYLYFSALFSDKAWVGFVCFPLPWLNCIRIVDSMYYPSPASIES